MVVNSVIVEFDTDKWVYKTLKTFVTIHSEVARSQNTTSSPGHQRGKSKQTK